LVNNEGTSHLPCGWSKEGLQTFNQLAKEVYKNRNEYGEEFDKAFKKSIEEEMASTTNKAGKRKRNCIETYNDLNQAELIMNKDNENNGDEEQDEGWVSKNVFIV
jgi:hypothetical protein